MKQIKSILLIFTLFFFSLTASALDFGSRVLLDKTYVRDNSYCRLENKRFEIEVRSFERYTSYDEAEYGEHAFIIQNDKYRLLPLNEKLIGRYKFLKGEDKNCTKSLSLKIGKSGLVVFFQKDNRPFLDTLSMVYYDDVTGQIDIKETHLPIQKAWMKDNLLHVYSHESLSNPELGKAQIRGKEFIYNEKPLGSIYIFDGKTISVDSKKSYESFPYKKSVKTIEEFEKLFKWNSTRNVFDVKKFYYAVHMNTRQECIRAEGSSDWNCSPGDF